MKKMIRGFALTALAAVAMLGIQQTYLQAESSSLGNDHKLEGGWDVVIWLPIGPGRSFIPTPYRILRTVGSAGVTDGYGFPALTFTPGAINGTGHGDYKRIGNNLYTSTVKYFELNYGSPAPPFGSVVNSIQTVQETIKLSADGNSYESDFLTTFRTPDGAVTGTNGGKTKATRIVAQP
jgi:hypothetical protein